MHAVGGPARGRPEHQQTRWGGGQGWGPASCLETHDHGTPPPAIKQRQSAPTVQHAQELAGGEEEREGFGGDGARPERGILSGRRFRKHLRKEGQTCSCMVLEPGVLHPPVPLLHPVVAVVLQPTACHSCIDTADKQTGAPHSSLAPPRCAAWRSSFAPAARRNTAQQSAWLRSGLPPCHRRKHHSTSIGRRSSWLPSSDSTTCHPPPTWSCSAADCVMNTWLWVMPCCQAAIQRAHMRNTEHVVLPAVE